MCFCLWLCVYECWGQTPVLLFVWRRVTLPSQIGPQQCIWRKPVHLLLQAESCNPPDWVLSLSINHVLSNLFILTFSRAMWLSWLSPGHTSYESNNEFNTLLFDIWMVISGLDLVLKLLLNTSQTKLETSFIVPLCVTLSFTAAGVVDVILQGMWVLTVFRELRFSISLLLPLVNNRNKFRH